MWARTITKPSARGAMTPSTADIRAETLRQLAARGTGKTICPSEVARALAQDWRALMVDVRAVAADLSAQGRIVVTQRGTVVDATSAVGPIRLGLAQETD